MQSKLFILVVAARTLHCLSWTSVAYRFTFAVSMMVAAAPTPVEDSEVRDVNVPRATPQICTMLGCG